MSIWCLSWCWQMLRQTDLTPLSLKRKSVSGLLLHYFRPVLASVSNELLNELELGPLYYTCRFTSWSMFTLLSFLIYSIPLPHALSWGYCLVRDAWGLCLRCADERSAVKRQNCVETKGFFLLYSHIGAILVTAVPLPGVPNSDLIFLSLSIPSTLRVSDLWKYQKANERAHQSGRENGRHVFLKGPSSCLLLTKFFFHWDSRDGELSNRHRGRTPDPGRWLLSSHNFSPRWAAGLCVMKEDWDVNQSPTL